MSPPPSSAVVILFNPDGSGASFERFLLNSGYYKKFPPPKFPVGIIEEVYYCMFLD